MELKFILESLLFAAQKPLNPTELRELLAGAAEESDDVAVKSFKKAKPDDVDAVLEQLAKEHAEAQRSYRLACVAGAWQFVSLPEYAPWLRGAFAARRCLPNGVGDEKLARARRSTRPWPKRATCPR